MLKCFLPNFIFCYEIKGHDFESNSRFDNNNQLCKVLYQEGASSNDPFYVLTGQSQTPQTDALIIRKQAGLVYLKRSRAEIDLSSKHLLKGQLYSNYAQLKLLNRKSDQRYAHRDGEVNLYKPLHNISPSSLLKIISKKLLPFNSKSH